MIALGPRILPFLPLLGLASGLWISSHPVPALAAFAAVSWTAWRLAPSPALRVAALAGLLALAGAAAVASGRPPPLEPPLGAAGRFRGLVVEDPRPTDAGWSAVVELTGWAPAPIGPWRPARGRVRLSVEGWPEPRPARGGACWFRGELRRPVAFRNPGSEGYAAYLRRKGIGARAGTRWPGEVTFRPPPPGWQAWRQAVAAAMERAAPGPGGAVLRAMTLGDRSGVGRELAERLRRAGVSHLVAVSGLHLGILALLVIPVARAALLRGAPTFFLARPVDPWARAACLPVLLGYAALSGWQVSTLRALVMVGLVLLAGAAARPRALLPGLGAAALLVGVANPAVLGDPGLHLSLSALAGLFWLAPGLEARLLPARPDPVAARYPPPGLRRWGPILGRAAARVAFASAGATLATLPVSLLHFGAAPVAGVVTNLVSVPLVGWGCLPLGLLGVGMHPLVPRASAFLWELAGGALNGWVAGLGTLEDWAGMVRAPFLASPLGFAGLAAAGLGLGLWLWRRPEAWRWAAAGAMLCAAAALGPRMRESLDPRVHLWVFDVGQGQALALRVPEAGWIAVDAGGFPGSTFDPGAEVVVPALEALGCRGLRVAVSTHPHPDHLLGLPALVRWGRPGEVWLPAGFRGDGRYRDLLEAAREVGAAVRWVGAADLDLPGPARLTAWEGPGPSENDRSLLLRIEAHGGALLLPGDLEAPGQAAALAAVPELGAAVLVAPHHGAADAWHPGFFRAVSPAWVVVSAAGRRGLPAAAFVEGATRLGARVLGTHQAGCVHVALGPGGRVRAGPFR
ncbi:ComEC/Rec2 family competence protein [Deferrisoma palaeochoriense]